MRALIVGVCILAGCAAEPTPPVQLRVEAGSAGSRLVLVPLPGWRINARLPPAFESAEGGVVRFHATEVSADSAYYLVPPAAAVSGGASRLRGTLRASVCAVGEQVCRPYVKRLDS
jgi:hypothetical protein